MNQNGWRIMFQHCQEKKNMIQSSHSKLYAQCALMPFNVTRIFLNFILNCDIDQIEMYDGQKIVRKNFKKIS